MKHNTQKSYTNKSNNTATTGMICNVRQSKESSGSQSRIKKKLRKRKKKNNKNKMRNYSQMKTRVNRPTFTSKLRYTKPISKQIALRNQGKSQIHSSK